MTFELLPGHELLRLIVSIVASYLLALPLGWERKRHSHAYIGLRVFPLVAVGACVYVFLANVIVLYIPRRLARVRRLRARARETTA